MFERYVAIGDSTTEGLDDPDGSGGYRGWANRLAEQLTHVQGRLLYANLAIRGRVTRSIREEQLPRALALRPDLSTVVSGVNDLLRPGFDAAALGGDLEAMFSALTRQGTTVLTFTLPEMSRVTPLGRLLRSRIEALNQAIRTAAHRTGARVADLARHPVAGDPRLWSDDRLHANALGHARIAAALAQALGLPGADARWTEPLPPPPTRSARGVLVAELAWSRRHFLPWLARHALGRSSGDGRRAKHPELTPLQPPLRADGA